MRPIVSGIQRRRGRAQTGHFVQAGVSPLVSGHVEVPEALPETQPAFPVYLT